MCNLQSKLPALTGEGQHNDKEIGREHCQDLRQVDHSDQRPGCFCEIRVKQADENRCADLAEQPEKKADGNSGAGKFDELAAAGFLL